MKVILYHTEDDINVINKTITKIEELENIVFLDKNNVTSPLLKIKKTVDLNNINYIFIEELNRYYIVQDKRIENNDIITFYLICDVLETYKTDILKSSLDVVESENILNEDRIDYESENTETTLKYEFDDVFTEKSDVLITVVNS